MGAFRSVFFVAVLGVGCVSGDSAGVASGEVAASGAGTGAASGGVTGYDAGVDGTVAAEAGSDATPQGPVCPITVPPNGSTPCVYVNPDSGVDMLRFCEYGGNAYGDCTTVAECLCPACIGQVIVDAETSPPLNGSWQVTPPYVGCGQNASACPATYGEGGACSPPVEGTCDYPEGTCGCEFCMSDANNFGYWRCRPWDEPIGPGCPAATERPLIGTACTLPEGTVCAYRSCCAGPPLGPNLQCASGVWSTYFGMAVACECAMIPECP
jgi:hypothetical protein